jgi:Zn-dependent protease
MSWAWRIARVSGIDIKIHVTFPLILVLGGWQGGARHGANGAVFGVSLVLALFLCVTLHELGHSVVAQHFGIPVRQIILLPLGGVALISRNPDRPVHELLIAVAGPLVNVGIAAVLLPLAGAALAATGFDGRGLVDGIISSPSLAAFVVWLLAANVTLVLFNLIPAFPLDGGRMLRALLAMRMDFPRATRIASKVGEVFAVVFGLFGVLTGNFVLVLVAVFVFFGASQENIEAQARTALATLRVGDAYNKYVLTLSAGDRLTRVVDYILTSYQPDFAVLFGRQLLGVVTRDDVLRALHGGDPDLPVTQIMNREVLRVDAESTLDQVRQTMGEHATRIAAVFHGDAFLGLISREDIAEAFAVLAAVGGRGVAAPTSTPAQ